MPGSDDREARRTARYVDGLLAGGPTSADLDPALRRVARRLRSDLVPVHPSFRFQEDLAAKLAVAAAQMKEATETGRASTADRREPVLLVLPAPADVPAGIAEGESGALRRVKPLIVGGVAASALSLGAVIVAWRFARPASTTAPAARPIQRGRRSSVLHGILGVVS